MWKFIKVNKLVASDRQAGLARVRIPFAALFTPENATAIG
jgi:hypothetical protein